AKSAADYRAVIDHYGSSPVAGDASLLLAKSLRGGKKYAEANEVLAAFVKAQPQHPFAPLAKVATAENLALSGRGEEAVKSLETIAQTDAKSFVAPYALLLAAELKTAQGQRESALRSYRELQSAFPTSVSAQVSAPTAEELGSMVEHSAPPAQAR
ncbi:MAG: tetratricopeptide repeat protein, partial [Terrimicrobiaceae bacterium]|nr:tetratricopeptide repeat protein [Terrimicrobiaceae bacterium]